MENADRASEFCATMLQIVQLSIQTSRRSHIVRCLEWSLRFRKIPPAQPPQCNPISHLVLDSSHKLGQLHSETQRAGTHRLQGCAKLLRRPITERHGTTATGALPCRIPGASLDRGEFSQETLPRKKRSATVAFRHLEILRNPIL